MNKNNYMKIHGHKTKLQVSPSPRHGNVGPLLSLATTTTRRETLKYFVLKAVFEQVRSCEGDAAALGSRVERDGICLLTYSMEQSPS